MVAVPSTSDGSRMRAGSLPSLRLSQASTKNSGGEFSGPKYTVADSSGPDLSAATKPSKSWAVSR